MVKIINIVRYALSIVLPLLCLTQPIEMFFVSFFLLAVNNIVDDIVFYYGNLGISTSGYFGGIASPVNGIVTKKEYGVDLFNDISKIDPLTKEKILNVSGLTANDNKKYNHITIYLNKFNHHISINPSKLLSVGKHYRDGEMEDMVIGDNLIIEDGGTYLLNDCVVFKYSDCYVILTMDKYISKYYLQSGVSLCPSCMICRGSQCDIYIPEGKRFICDKWDCVNVYDTIVRGGYQFLPIRINSYIREINKSGVELVGGFKKILLDNVKKTFSTFAIPTISVAVILSWLLMLLNVSFVYIASVVLYLFVLVRFYKHLMYSMMNMIGYKRWMQQSYQTINKISKLWKKS